MPAEQYLLQLGDLPEQQAPAKPKRARFSKTEEVTSPAMRDLIAVPPQQVQRQPIEAMVTYAEQHLASAATRIDVADTSHDRINDLDAPQRPPFGLWLLQQASRKGFIGDLAKGVRADPAFPKRGTVDDVRRRFRQIGAEGEAFEALDDAELNWLAL